MAIRHNNDEIITKRNINDDSITANKKISWPTNDSISSLVSFDGNIRVASSSESWSEDIEEAATRKIVNLWRSIERTLYNENEQVSPGIIMDECIQWRMQIPHFRVVGVKKSLEIEDNDSESEFSVEYKSHCTNDRPIDDVTVDNNTQQKRFSNIDGHNDKIDVRKEEIIERILEFICNELEKEDNNITNDYNDDDDIESLNNNLDEVLTITPAPTYNDKRNIKIKKIIKSNSRMNSANVNESFQVTERKINIASTRSRKNAKNPRDNNSTIVIYDDDDDDDDDDDNSDIDESTIHHIRNKPGTVFNEKIVVSPVPYAVTTRESFCTLKTTPIRYAGHLLELSTPYTSKRNMNSASKINSANGISYLRVPQRHSGWQSSIYPVAWPKNVRLAPIDPSRLPSSKKRSSTVSPSIPQRNRNSLSPISRPLRITTTATTTIASDTIINNDDLLKIDGKQIVTCAVKPNLLKTALKQCPNTDKNNRKIKIKSDKR